MTIHRENVGFIFTPAKPGETLNNLPLLVGVTIHFDDGLLAGLQLSGLGIVGAIDPLGRFEQFIPGPLAALPGNTLDFLCGEAFSAYDEYRSLSAADPSAEGFPLSAYAGRELPRL